MVPNDLFLEAGLEDVLLHVGNKYLSVSATPAIHTKESHNTMYLLVKHIKYNILGLYVNIWK
jgi:hypothetical protein